VVLVLSTNYLINSIIFKRCRVLLTTEEIKEALIAQGGIDVVVVEMREPIETLTHLVVASGRSTKHIRKMSDSIVQAVGHMFDAVCVKFRCT
jgi:ribosomal silencing factor RsfS